MKVEKVAILGAGNGGITAAADLKSRGFEVRLYELPQFGRNLDQIKKENGILFKSKNGSRKVIPDMVTTCIEDAVKGADVVLLVIPSFAVEAFAKVSAPVIEEEQPILITSSSALGSLRFVNTAREMGIHKKFKIGETNTLPYGTRAFPEKAEVELAWMVTHIYFAAYPAKNTNELLKPFRQLYEYIFPVSNIWEVTLRNGNPEIHPGPVLLNAGRIDYSKGEFYLYKEGMTEHTVNLVYAVSAERKKLAEAFGFEVDDPKVSRQKRGSIPQGSEPLDVLLRNSEVLSNIKGPICVDNRYLTEDIPMGLVLMSSLGKTLGIPTPAADAIITLGSIILKQNFMDEGITLEKLGIGGLSPNDLNQIVA
jgi:opine dehydrogenase